MFCCGVVPLSLAIIYSGDPFRSISHIHDQLQQSNSLSSLSPIQYYNIEGKKVQQLQYFQTSQVIKLTYNQILKNITIENHNNKFSFWTVLKPNQNWLIQKKSQFRLAQIPFQIYDVYNFNQLKYQFQTEELKQNVKGSCRFCYGEEENKTDPFLTFCKCTGTVEHIHLNCLREWVQSKANILITNKICFVRLFNIKCDLCKQDLPFEIERSNKKYTIFNYKKQFKPEQQLSQSQCNTNQIGSGGKTKAFVIKSQKKNERGEKMIELVIASILEGQSIFLGSNFMNGIMMRDSNVSDYHAYITNKDSNLWLTDFNSDLGSFYRIKSNETIMFEGEKGVAVQLRRNKEKQEQHELIHKTVMAIKAVKRWTNVFAKPGSYTINFVPQ